MGDPMTRGLPHDTEPPGPLTRNRIVSGRKSVTILRSPSLVAVTVTEISPPFETSAASPALSVIGPAFAFVLVVVKTNVSPSVNGALSICLVGETLPTAAPTGAAMNGALLFPFAGAVHPSFATTLAPLTSAPRSFAPKQ